MSPDYRPRRDDHRIEPFLEGLQPRDPPARRSRAKRLALLLALLGLAAALSWFWS